MEMPIRPMFLPWSMAPRCAAETRSLWPARGPGNARGRTFVMQHAHLDAPKPDLILDSSIWRSL